MQRQLQIESWLKKHHPGQMVRMELASADASSRRYFRAFFDGESSLERSLIVMDAPPISEDCGPWLNVQRLFKMAGVHVPQVLAIDMEQGFLLLSDLGDTTYLAALSGDQQSDVVMASSLYEDAISALISIQVASRPGILPIYDRTTLRRELDLFPDWYVSRYLGVTLTRAQLEVMNRAFDIILSINLAEPQVFVHRDYHSRNLMRLDGGSVSPGIIDFQDAVYGPISYDLVSLFKDAYIEWDEELILDWLIRYWEKARKVGLPICTDFSKFYLDYEWMGVQRHIKILGIFARLYHRDGKDGYIKDMPRVMRYLRKATARYQELGPFHCLLDELEDRTVTVGYTF